MLLVLFFQMDDFSDESDVNPEEMARMVEDFDDLDNNLLGGSAKKDVLTAAGSRDAAEVKKKVSFKSGFDKSNFFIILQDFQRYCI